MNVFRNISSFFLACAVLVSVASPAFAQGIAGQIQGGLNAAAPAGYKTNTTLPQLVGRLISAALTFVGVLLLGYLIYAGFLWMTASDSKQVDKAKEIIKNTIVGLIIIFLAYAISSEVLNLLAGPTTGVTKVP